MAAVVAVTVTLASVAGHGGCWGKPIITSVVAPSLAFLGRVTCGTAGGDRVALLDADAEEEDGTSAEVPCLHSSWMVALVSLSLGARSWALVKDDALLAAVVSVGSLVS